MSTSERNNKKRKMKAVWKKELQQNVQILNQGINFMCEPNVETEMLKELIRFRNVKGILDQIVKVRWIIENAFSIMSQENYLLSQHTSSP